MADKIQSSYVNSVYINQSIYNVDKTGYKSVYAKKDISTNDLLLLEHTFSGSTSNCL